MENKFFSAAPKPPGVKFVLTARLQNCLRMRGAAMNSSEFWFRRRVFVKRVASVLSAGLAISLAGCGSQGISFSDDGAPARRYSKALSVPVPSEPVYGHSSRGGGTGAPFASNYARDGYGGAIRRDSLVPVRTASYEPDGRESSRAFGQNDGGKTASYPRYASNAADAGGIYAMGSAGVDRAGTSAEYANGQPKRYAASDYPSYGYDARGDRYSRSYRDDRGYRSAPYYDRTGSAYEHYVVAEGDTLYGIAQRHGMTTVQLAELNGLNGSTIHPGQKLRVYGSPKYTSTSRYKDAPQYDNGYGGRSYGQVEKEAEERKAPTSGYASYRDYKPYRGYGNGGGSDYGRAPSYSQGKSYEEREAGYGAPRYGYEEKRGASSYDRQASRHDERRDETYPPRYRKPKGSYTAYSVQPGDTLFDIARRNGLSHRELADYNDIPSSARLYAGQVLHIPKGRGYDWGEKRRDAKDDGDTYEEGGNRSDERGYERDEDTRRSPYSQKSPEGKTDGRDGERRVAVAKADTGDGEGRKTMSDAPSGVVEPGAQSAGRQPQTILAAQREVEPAAGGFENGAKDCESLLAAPLPRSAQSFREPVEGLIVSKFGAKSDGSFNDGIDFSVPKGTPVKAAENGVVAYAGNEVAGFGNLVLVRHADGYVTAYAHNDELLVKRCDVVKRGQIIAKAGASGKVSKPQLHFEVRKDAKPVDPEGYFSRS
jgi:murein DD-endopeptidase MepM/ murein hydrolase activator NlpD